MSTVTVCSGTTIMLSLRTPPPNNGEGVSAQVHGSNLISVAMIVVALNAELLRRSA
ncbi:hypothetical protein [Micromonospora sp. WMMC250]|uniref:hypothetical protein n=1 Tax=Micromonospora sp. WMMC250 TaxID=3014781 RepID=UPI0022B71367|nr:hypothetical protein [Micromonospora sp. WMMC250]MCZ7379823.1 hypothetical protein [Micromonospora sp. WMMC250]